MKTGEFLQNATRSLSTSYLEVPGETNLLPFRSYPFGTLEDSDHIHSI